LENDEMRNKKRIAAFSLVELVIVIVIIGIIAAIAVPRIGRGAKGATDAAVRASLTTLRNAIDLYAAEHNGKFPASDVGDTDTDFINQLTQTTDISGTVGTGAGFIYGPYLRSGLPPCPVGPNPNASGIIVGTTGPAVDEAQTTKGWVYNSSTGDLIINTDDVDDMGTQYDAY
jgi:prepilin-type N-terminal cleavage/methylation domain-containing protein